MKSRELQSLWWEWLATSEKLVRSLHEQTVALTLRDPARMEKVQPALDHLLTRMQDIDDRALAEAQKLCEESGVRPGLRDLVGFLGKEEGMQLQALANRMIVATREVQKLMNKNRALIENELTYINGTLTLIAKAATEPKGPYRTQKTVATSVLMDQAA